MPTTLLNPLPPRRDMGFQILPAPNLTLGPTKQGNATRLAQHRAAGHPFIYSFWAGDFANNAILKHVNMVSIEHWKTED